MVETLRRFSRRRRLLILLRGICGVAAVWLATMTALALLDRLVLVEDSVRVALSLLAYLSAAGVLWHTCVRSLVHLPTPRELARLLEVAAPPLRERLLAAVELAESSRRPHWDSDEFRAAIQELVAHDLGRLQVESLLRPRLIASWLSAASVAIAVLLALLGVPHLRFPQAFARAALPLANFARPSSLSIEILSPSPPEQTVPEGDPVPVTVRVSGGEPRRVVLETFPKRGSRERILMSLSAVHQFTATVPVGQTPVRYRIRAGDAVTQKFLLQPQPRPRVVRFHKTYCYPAYSRLAARTVTEENGDLEALEGTEVELKLAVDQPIREAALRLELGKTAKDLPLQPLPSGEPAARVPLTADGTYRVRLVSAATGFENKYSPQYEIRVRPDLVPSAKIEHPQDSQLVLPPDAVVALSGSACDDLGLLHVEHAVQINHGAWQSFALGPVSGAVAHVSRSWDLFELGLHPGDRLLAKLVATDLKGQRGESLPLRILIATPGFDPQRHARLKAKQTVERALQELREASDQLAQKFHSAKTLLQSRAATRLQQQQAIVAARAAAEAASEKAAEALRQIQESLPKMTTVRESGDLVLVGAAVSHALREGIEPLQNALERATDRMSGGDEKAARTTLQKAQDALNAAVGAPRLAADHYRQIVAAEHAQAVLSDLAQVDADQRALNEQLRQSAQLERAIRRQNVLADQTRQTEQQMKRLVQQGRDEIFQAVHHTAEALARQRAELEQQLAREPTAETLRPAAEAMQRGVAEATRKMQPLERELSRRADLARQRLSDRFAASADTLAKIARPTTTPEQMDAVAHHLKDRAALEERRPQPDARFAADASRVGDILQALGDSPVSPQTAAALSAVEKAWRKLETGHRLTEQLTALRQLAAQERWEHLTPAETARRTADWRWSQQQLKSLPEQSRRAQLPAEAAQSLEKIAQHPATERVNAEMRVREETAAATTNLAQPVSAVANELSEVAQQLQPYMDEARAEIERLAPKLSDRMAGLAQHTETLRAQTDQQAQQAKQPDTAEKIRSEARTLAHEQQKLDHRVRDIREAIRRDANVQNLATEEGRQRARDADDADAMLREPSPSARDLLQYAAQTPQPEQQQTALKSAADLQEKLAQTLRQLAEHYKNLEAGLPSATRMALREAEKEMGLKPTLDAEYAKAQALEQLAGMTPLEQLRELEKALQQSKPMRAELSDIAKNALQNAADDLERAARAEQTLAQQMTQPVEAAAKQPAIEQTVRDAGNDIARAGRHESRLGNETVGQQLQQLGQHIENTTAGQIAQAGQQMAQSPSPSHAQAAAATAASAIQEAAQQVRAWLQQPLPPPPTPTAMETTAGRLASADGATAQWLARALDSLDATMNPATRASSSDTVSSPTQTTPTQAAGKGEPSPDRLAASQAARAQAFSMMSARAQGLTPGQQPMSENEGTGTGAAFRAAGAEVGQLPELLRRLRGDWGKLPPKLARDLMESQQETVAGEYREMVELYFRAIADRATEGK